MAPIQHQSSATSTDNCYNNSASRVNTNKTTESKSKFSSSINKSQSYSSSNSSSSSLNSSSNSGLHNSNDLNNSCKEKNNAIDQYLLNFGSSTNLPTFLSVTTRGPFYHDTFFKDIRQHYDAAVREVLDNWGQRSELDDDLTTYRKLREVNLTDASQATTVTEDDTQHQVVMDVVDFPRECVVVKMVDENELVVEGSVDQQEGTSTSTKSFCRRFTFPGLVRPEVITSTMSSDGVLTITVPKKVCGQREKAVKEETVKAKPQKLENSHKVTDTTSMNNNTTKQSTFDSSKLKEEKYQTQKNVSMQKTKESSVTSEDTMNEQVKSATNGTVPSFLLNSSNILPIISKGDFFQDSHFANVREDFEAAVQRVLKSWNETSEDDVMKSYRNLRTRELKEQNQAVSLTEDAKQHKVVLDVHDFPRECVVVKMVDENELVVEGSVDQREGTSTSTKSFCRRFTFPGLVRPEVVTSTMSSDGVLTITVPKKICGKNEIAVDEETVKTKPQQLNNSQKKTDTTSTNSKTAKWDSFDSSKKEKSHTQKNVSFQKTKQTSVRSEDISKNQQNAATNEATTNLLLNSLNQLPITSKGDFFHDSHFANVREDFEAAVQRVLKSWNETSEDDVMKSYRNLRTRELKEENQAVSLTEDVKQHKVVLDVHDFPRECVVVKVVDENELVVEGSVDQREGTSTSTKSFCRSFTFPGLVRPEVVTSTMSSDGVLTITVPKKEPSKEQELNMKTTTKNSNRSVSTENSLKDQIDAQTSTSKSYSSISNMARGYSSQMTEEMKKSSASEDDRLSSTATKGSKSFLPEDSLLFVDKKGLFFHDDFFQNARQDYESAINEVLTRFSLTQPSSDDLSTYRHLRQRDFGDESQAMNVTEDQDTHKVVMDVRDFMKGDIKVKMVGEKEVEVEGVVVENEGKKSTRKFSRRVHLPGKVDVEGVTSAMSSDGVLTITAPKVVKK